MQNFVLVPLENLMEWKEFETAGNAKIAGNQVMGNLKVKKGGNVSFDHPYDPFAEGKDKPKLDLVNLMEWKEFETAGNAKIAGNQVMGNLKVKKGGNVSFDHPYDPFAEGKDKPKGLLLLI